MPNKIGLDIGTHSIKASIFDGTFGRYSFVRTEQELIVSGDEPLIERQQNALFGLWRRIEAGEVVTTLSAKDVSVRKLTTPFTDLKKIEQILPSMVEELVPFEIDDINISHHLLDMTEEESTLLVLISPKAKVSEHIAMFSSLDISPKNIVIDADIMNYFATEGTQALVNIGLDSTICALYKDGKTLTFRTLTQGVGTEEEIPTSLLHRIRNTLIQFEDQYDEEVDEVLFFGEGASLEEAEVQLSEELGVSIQTPALPNNSPPEYALAIALGAKAAGETHGREFDLRMGDFAYKGNLQGAFRLLQAAAVLSLLALIGCTGWYFIQSSAKNKELIAKQEEFNTEIRKMLPDISNSALKTPSTAISLIQGDLTSSNQKLDKLGSITSDIPPTLNILKEISEGVPPHKTARIDVKEMTISKTSINIKAETDGFQTATEIEKSLKQKPMFKQARKADEKSLRNGISFSIIIPLKIEEETEEEEG